MKRGASLPGFGSHYSLGTRREDGLASAESIKSLAPVQVSSVRQMNTSRRRRDRALPLYPSAKSGQGSIFERKSDFAIAVAEVRASATLSGKERSHAHHHDSFWHRSDHLR